MLRHVSGKRWITCPPSWNVVSSMFIPTLRESPAEAVIASHKLLLRGGYVRQSSAGVYAFLPLGLRVLRKISNVVEEEMDAIGCRQLSLPLVLPEEMWQVTGRWQSTGDELIRLKDRKGASYCLAPTHEESVTSVVAGELSSYRQLPVKLYQIGKKYRDEIRPRFGLMRGREFVMKDLYTFDETQQKAYETYRDVCGAYETIFDRLGLSWVKCEADSGNIGGSMSHEYQVRCPVGEDTLVFCDKCGYSANIEKAVSGPKVTAADLAAADTEVVLVRLEGSIQHGSNGVDAVIDTHVVVPKGVVINPIAVATALGFTDVKNSELTPAVVGNTRLNDLATVLSERRTGSATVILDESVASHPSKPALPMDDVLRADLQFPRGIGLCSTGDCPRVPTTSAGMEVGHVFYLGTKYSEPMNARFTSRTGQPTLSEMGCYGIGVSRLISAVAECNHDIDGLKWPLSVAPFQVCIVPLSAEDAIANTAIRLYEQLTGSGSRDAKTRWNSPLRGETIMDDRDFLGGGAKLRDAKLVGYPFIVVIGKRSLERGSVEVHERATGCAEEVNVEDVASYLSKKAGMASNVF